MLQAEGEMKSEIHTNPVEKYLQMMPLVNRTK